MFQKVILETAISGLSDPKLAPDKAVELVRQSILVPATKVALANFNAWKAHLEKKRAEAKKLLETAEGKLRQMQEPDRVPIPYTTGEIDGATQIIKVIAKQLGVQALEYANAFAADGFRGDAFIKSIEQAFPQIARKDLDLFESFVQSVRAKIIAGNRVLGAVRDRVGEYATRCDVLHDTALTTYKKALGVAEDLTERLEKCVKDCRGAETEATECLRKVGNKIRAVNDTLAKKPDKNTSKMIAGLLGERTENIKKASGSLKTFRLVFEQGEKVYDGSPTEEVVKSFTSPMVRLKMSLVDLQEQLDKFKTKEIPKQDKAIVAAGYKVD
jgi:hypothetical protein